MIPANDPRRVRLKREGNLKRQKQRLKKEQEAMNRHPFAMTTREVYCRLNNLQMPSRLRFWPIRELEKIK